jgi:glycosyltransferase involved in cell wall biosynthesis
LSPGVSDQPVKNPTPQIGEGGAGPPAGSRGLVIVPAYNEEHDIEALTARIRNSVSGDVLYVNDGSSDRTRDRLERAGANVLSHPINLGYAEALKSGISFALREGYDYCVFLDADGQHDPAEVDRLVASLHERRADLVVGSRFCERTGYEPTAGRRLGMILFAKVASLMTGQKITDPTSGFKVLSRRAMEAMVGKVFGDLHAELVIYLSALGLKVVEEPIHVAPRRQGRSMYNLGGAVVYPLRTLLVVLIAYLEARFGRKRGERT